MVRRSEVSQLEQADHEFRFATAVAGFGQLLRGKSNLNGWTYENARALAAASVGNDPYGYRSELVRLAGIAKTLDTSSYPAEE